ncbi:alcohol oxidase [Conidiobolus coronatus NRRL 28638]|uniref:Alcohol oxidase n=1 Tax=Conidiobolus coronatus (strain ATCC 28846 / CBS 209.66 / NRRL 28638) TaxID=796925 RepID=A0A137P199_CONC2|nr:alcohol oxidase [Conidiobolus coronatus NRRL 28638]|eukprot:KXN68817.1 alcohol oxidase [Conidiobolus coronatus NRRL 28638]
MYFKLIIFSLLFAVIQCNSGVFDYIVVGAGPAGSMTALELARHGFSTLLIDAGSKVTNTNITTPGLAIRTLEDESLAWDFRVDYMNQPHHKRQNVLYPRASGIGGCTNHNAMANIYPRFQSFQKLVEITGDQSWSEATFRKYFESIKLTSPAPINLKFDRRFLPLTTDKFTGMKPDPKSSYIVNAIGESIGHDTKGENINELNAIGNSNNETESQYLFPSNIDRTVKSPIRRGIFRAVIDEIAKNPKLTVWTDSLVTKIILEGNSAIGVEYMSGKYLYRASAIARRESKPSPLIKKVFANKEVIVSGGAFNTPQIMMLSGIGDFKELRRLGIKPKVNLPGVGKNLRDHQELSLVYELNSDWTGIENCYFKTANNDSCWQQYQNGTGAYTVGGPLHLQMLKSNPKLTYTDTWYYSNLGRFTGFFDDTVEVGIKSKRHISYVVLNPYSNSNKGFVTLKTRDPRDVPYINILQYDDSTNSQDLQKMLYGFNQARKALQIFNPIGAEIIPGKNVQTEEEIKNFILNNTFSHHACCSMKIGKDDDELAVLDNEFRVRGVENLRVVDQSVLPETIGDFPALFTSLLGLKAAEAILSSN